MSLFDLFKKKSPDEAESSELEELLKKAALDGSFRVMFYKKLLVSDLFVLTQGNDIPEGRQTLAQDTSLKILSFADGRIPVFTSTDRIFDTKVIDQQVPFVAMKGSDLFNVVRGATLVLNPYSDYGKELLPDEIDRLLDGSIFSSAGQTITVSRPTEVLLGQPAKRPDEMLDGLRTLFNQRGEVSACYLGWIDYGGTTDVPPHFVLGIKADNYTRELVEETGFTARQYLGPDEQLDLIELKTDDGVSDYLRTTQPFYER